MTSPAAAPVDRAAVNRANAQHSTGPRTDDGKQRAARNALRHGLTAHTAVLPTEDPDAYQRHVQQFLDEYQPATATETQLVHDLANTAWRLNRIPLIEADLLARAIDPPSIEDAMKFNIADVHRSLATLGMHGHRLSRQFHKTLEQLRAIQAERRNSRQRDLADAAALLELQKQKGIPAQAAQLGFVFSKPKAQPPARPASPPNAAGFRPADPLPDALPARQAGTGA